MIMLEQPVRTVHQSLHPVRAIIAQAMVAAGPQCTAARISSCSYLPCRRRLLRPRKGHLLEIDYPPSIPPLHSGVMEMSYTKVSAGFALWH